MTMADFRSVTVVLPMHYELENVTLMIPTFVEVDRDGLVNIKIEGIKHARTFMDMILTQQLTGFSMNQQPAQSGIPGHDVEVTVEPPACGNHKPAQHRDGMEPWCSLCSLNAFYEEPRRIAFGNRRFVDGPDAGS